MPAPAPDRSGRCHGLRPDAAGAATAWLPPAAEWPCSIRSPKCCWAFAANPQHRGTMFRRLRHVRRQRAGLFPAGCAAPPGTPHCIARQPLPARGRAPGFRLRTQGYRTPARPADVPRQRQTVLRWRWHRAQAAPPPGPPRKPALRAPAQLPAGWVPHRAAQRRCSCTPRWYWPPAAAACAAAMHGRCGTGHTLQ